jgi:hypothetical protein
MREAGWLQDVFKAASKRVEAWPEWKKESEARESNCEGGELLASHADADSQQKDQEEVDRE